MHQGGTCPSDVVLTWPNRCGLLSKRMCCESMWQLRTLLPDMAADGGVHSQRGDLGFNLRRANWTACSTPSHKPSLLCGTGRRHGGGGQTRRERSRQNDPCQGCSLREIGGVPSMCGNPCQPAQCQPGKLLWHDCSLSPSQSLLFPRQGRSVQGSPSQTYHVRNPACAGFPSRGPHCHLCSGWAADYWESHLLWRDDP